jgi:flagellar biosynthesis/type III secretory pathway protein FliH
MDFQTLFQCFRPSVFFTVLPWPGALQRFSVAGFSVAGEGTMGKQIFSIGAGFVAAVLLSGPAQAQVNGWLNQRTAYSDEYRQSYYEARRIAYDNGYREGLRDGESAARKGRPFDVQREKDWRKADAGYNRSYGDKDRYRDSFRSGYSDGYRAAYDRLFSNGGYYDPSASRRDGGYGYPGTNPGYPQNGRVYGQGRYGDYGTGVAHIAFQNGVNDGYEKGLDDARDRKYPDPTRQKWYRSGDRHYEGQYGSKEAYKDEYRRGFVEGYQRAYRDNRRF